MSRAESRIEGSYVTPSIEHAAVRDAMRPEVLTCPPDAALREVARTMASEHVHSVVVSGGLDGERKWGIVTDMDLMRAAREDSTSAPRTGPPSPSSCRCRRMSPWCARCR